MSLRLVVLIVVLAAASCPLIHPQPRPGVSTHLSVTAAAQAFQQGAEAAQLGQPISVCPFTGDEAARAWRAGWRWWHGAGAE